jgi:hypothetical protein
LLKNLDQSMTTHPNIPRRIADGFIVALLLLAPIKFGGLWNTGGIAMYPLDIWEWLFASWPPVLMPALCGLALMLTIVVYPAPSQDRTPLPLLRPHVLTLLLVVATLPGLIHTTSWFEAQLFLWHLTGAACLALAVHIIVRHDPRRLWLFTAAIAVAGAWVVLQGWRQVPGGGIEATLEMAREMARENGQELPRAFVKRLEGGRAFGSFFLPNSYAAHLLLTGPVLTLLVWFGVRSLGFGVRGSGLRNLTRTPDSGTKNSEPGTRNPEPTTKNQEPRNRNRQMIAGLAIVATATLWLGSLYFSRSRAALVATVLCAAATVVSVLPGRRRKLLTGTLCLVAGVAFFLAVQHGRSFSSLEARSNYWSAALRMTREAPMTGKGLYEFFPHYMKYKSAETEETRLPHNALLAFASQAGLLAAVVFASFAICGARNFYRGLRRPLHPERLLRTSCALGFMAWWLHSLTDVNIQIPGSVATAWVLLVLSSPPSRDSAQSPQGKRMARRWVLGLLAATAIAGCWRLPAERLYKLITATRTTPKTLPLIERATERVGNLDPFTPYAWEHAGKQAQSLQNYKLAAKFFAEAAKRSPHRSSLWFHLAECRLKLGDTDAARTAFFRAREWYPEAETYRDFEENISSGTTDSE